MNRNIFKSIPVIRNCFSSANYLASLFVILSSLLDSFNIKWDLQA